MAHEQVDPYVNMVVEVEGHPMDDFLDDLEYEFDNRDGANADVDDYDLLTGVSDTTARLARQGLDIQGIQWDRLNISRENYRSTRLEQYKNYENIPSFGEAVDKEHKQVEKGGNYFEFFLNSRLVKPTILHFQDFAHYKSEVYKHVTGDVLGGHAVKLIGWGTSESREDYWLIANQWNKGWGEDGLFRIKRGTNECGIEEDVVGGLPSSKNLSEEFIRLPETGISARDAASA